MPHQVTVTGKIGPDRTLTALVLQNAIQVLFNPDLKQIRVRTGDNGVVKDIDIAAATTVTCVITAGNYAFTVS